MFGKKGQTGASAIWGLVGLGLVAMILGIIGAYGAQITEDVSEDFETNSYADNITKQSLENQMTVQEKSSTVFTISIGVLILGIVLGVVGLIAAYRNGMF